MVGAFIIFSWNQIDKTKSALRLTRESINLAKENAKAELRAYIVTSFMDSTEFQGDTLFATVDVINVGKTPAYKVRKNAIFKFYELVDSDFVKLEKTLPLNSIDVGVNVKQSSNNGADFKWFTNKPQIMHQLFLQGRISVYMAILITYNDFWGVSHFTHSYWKFSKGVVETMNKYNDSN